MIASRIDAHRSPRHTQLGDRKQIVSRCYWFNATPTGCQDGCDSGCWSDRPPASNTFFGALAEAWFLRSYRLSLKHFTPTNASAAHIQALPTSREMHIAVPAIGAAFRNGYSHFQWTIGDAPRTRLYSRREQVYTRAFLDRSPSYGSMRVKVSG